MNPDHFDPKSHVPSVHPGDDWGDLDRVSEILPTVLQPRRPVRGIPIKRELNPATAKRHAPYPILCDDDQVPLVETISIGAKEPAKPATKAARKSAKKTTKKTADQAPKTATKRSANKKAADQSGMSLDDAPEDPSEASESTANPALLAEAHTHVTEVPIMVERERKRFRVNEIAPQRPIENHTQKAPLILSKTSAIRVSNESLMNSGSVQSAEAISWGSTNVRATLAWIIGAGAAVILIVVAAILLSRPPKGGTEVKETSDFGEIEPEKSEAASDSEEVKPIDKLISGEDQAKRIFTKYVTSKSADDFLEVIYSPDKNGSLISRKWEPMGMSPEWKPENCTWTVTENAGTQFGILSGVLPDYSGFRAVFRQDGDVMKMDWRATAGHSSAAFSDLKRGQGDADEIRAILSPGDFHTFTLPEGEFRCYRLSAPDREENIWAYTKINSDIDAKLASQFVPSQVTGEAVSEIPVVIALARGPKQSLPNQWIIGKLVRMSWLDE